MAKGKGVFSKHYSPSNFSPVSLTSITGIPFFSSMRNGRDYSLLRSEVKHHIWHLYYRFGMQHRPEVTLYCWLALNLLVIHSFLTCVGSSSFNMVHSWISQPYKDRGNKSALQRESVLCEMARGKAPSSPNHFFIRTFCFKKSKQASNLTLRKAKAIQ